MPLLQAMVAKIEAVRPDLFGLLKSLPGSLSVRPLKLIKLPTSALAVPCVEAPGVLSTATKAIRPIRPEPCHFRDMSMRQIVAEICGYIDGLEGLRRRRVSSLAGALEKLSTGENLCQALNTFFVVFTHIILYI